MKTEFTKNGWVEVTTKVTTVRFRAKPFQTVQFWLDFTKKRPAMNTKGRNHCERCKKKWDSFDSEMMTFFVMTDRGNKVVCTHCWNSIGENFPKYLGSEIEEKISV